MNKIFCVIFCVTLKRFWLNAQCKFQTTTPFFLFYFNIGIITFLLPHSLTFSHNILIFRELGPISKKKSTVEKKKKKHQWRPRYLIGSKVTKKLFSGFCKCFPNFPVNLNTIIVWTSDPMCMNMKTCLDFFTLVILADVYELALFCL